jgi:CRISPR-associated endonuclease/helicase Cas3
VVQIPQEKPEPEEDEDSKHKIEYDWIPVPLHLDDIPFSPIYVVNPSLVKYDRELGFRFAPDGNADPNVLNEPVFRSKHRGPYSYQLEDYPHHIQEMIRVFETNKWRDRLQYAARRLEQKQGWAEGSIERVARLAIALHDVGKMDVRWQTWARRYQSKVKPDVTDPNFMIAHTNSQNDEHRRIAREIRPKRPPHAFEGAIAMTKLVRNYFSQQPNAQIALHKITLSAIARHHSSQTDSFDKNFHLEVATPRAIFAALENARIEVHQAAAKDIILSAPNTPPEKHILRGDDPDLWWLTYFLIVRALRLSDGESQEKE